MINTMDEAILNSDKGVKNTEIGHLAFYFYWGAFVDDKRLYDAIYDIREKQANWISSIAHNGAMDELIEENTTLQPPRYHNPVLLKHKSQPDYNNNVEGLYLRY